MVVLLTLKWGEAPEGRGWKLLVDTNTPYAEEEGVFEVGQTYQVTGRSLLLFTMNG